VPRNASVGAGPVENRACSRGMDEQRHPEVGSYRADGQYWSVRRTPPVAVFLTIMDQEKLAATGTTA